MFACDGLPDANGRIAYRGYIYNTFSTDEVTIRYRGVESELDRVQTSPIYGDALTAPFWGGSPTELQACAYISGHGFYCAWTANDGNS